MYAVIQEIKLKKPNMCGAYREYEITYTEMTRNGQTWRRYSYYPNDDAGRFERPHMEAYKVSVHRSYRKNGAVKKQQCAVATIGYYDFADMKQAVVTLITFTVTTAIQGAIMVKPL